MIKQEENSDDIEWEGIGKIDLLIDIRALNGLDKTTEEIIPKKIFGGTGNNHK